jgi:hypothetical protein
LTSTANPDLDVLNQKEGTMKRLASGIALTAAIGALSIPTPALGAPPKKTEKTYNCTNGSLVASGVDEVQADSFQAAGWTCKRANY